MKPPSEGSQVERLEVDVEGEFCVEGEPARNVTYRAKVIAHVTDARLRKLMLQTDALAEIRNTPREQLPVTLDHVEAVGVQT